jgi:glycosyltransferase involved in cell wall biosynthesis
VTDISPLRVAFDAVALLDTRTGVGRFVDETLERLALRGDLEITAFGYWPRARRRMQAVVPEGVGVSPFPMFGPPLRAMWRRGGFPPIELWCGRTDVVHGPNFLVPPAWRGAEVVTVHDLTILRYPEFCTDDTLQFPTLIRRAIARGAWIHTVSHFVGDEVVEQLGADPDRVVVIPNGVTPVPAADGAVVRSLAGGDRYVLAIGTVEPRKDLPRLVAAFDRLAAHDHDVRLVIAGPDGWGSDALRAALDGAHHRDRIVRLGWVSEQQRAELLRGAAVLAYPSLYEGFGLPPLEAMTAGTPVVSTRTGGITEVAADAALLVAPGDTEALAEALERVLSDGDLADDLRRRGTANATRFSWDRTASELGDLYQRVARDHRAARHKA